MMEYLSEARQQDRMRHHPGADANMCTHEQLFKIKAIFIIQFLNSTKYDI